MEEHLSDVKRTASSAAGPRHRWVPPPAPFPSRLPARSRRQRGAGAGPPAAGRHPGEGLLLRPEHPTPTAGFPGASPQPRGASGNVRADGCSGELLWLPASPQRAQRKTEAESPGLPHEDEEFPSHARPAPGAAARCPAGRPPPPRGTAPPRGAPPRPPLPAGAAASGPSAASPPAAPAHAPCLRARRRAVFLSDAVTPCAGPGGSCWPCCWLPPPPPAPRPSPPPSPSRGPRFRPLSEARKRPRTELPRPEPAPGSPPPGPAAAAPLPRPAAAPRGRPAPPAARRWLPAACGGPAARPASPAAAGGQGTGRRCDGPGQGLVALVGLRVVGSRKKEL